MASPLRISEAASLGMHAAVMLAGSPRRRSASGEMAAELGVSEAHLAKVLQRLGKAGLVSSTRGPGGGFALSRPAAAIRLLEVYEAIEGPLLTRKCLLGVPACGASRCLLGSIVAEVDKRVRDYLAKTTLSQLRGLFRREER